MDQSQRTTNADPWEFLHKWLMLDEHHRFECLTDSHFNLEIMLSWWPGLNDDPREPSQHIRVTLTRQEQQDREHMLRAIQEKAAYLHRQRMRRLNGEGTS